MTTKENRTTKNKAKRKIRKTKKVLQNTKCQTIQKNTKITKLNKYGDARNDSLTWSDYATGLFSSSAVLSVSPLRFRSMLVPGANGEPHRSHCGCGTTLPRSGSGH